MLSYGATRRASGVIILPRSTIFQKDQLSLNLRLEVRTKKISKWSYRNFGGVISPLSQTWQNIAKRSAPFFDVEVKSDDREVEP